LRCPAAGGNLAQRHPFDPALCEQDFRRENQPRFGIVAAHRALACGHGCHGVSPEFALADDFAAGNPRDQQCCTGSLQQKWR
jgi:hypothetical protein